MEVSEGSRSKNMLEIALSLDLIDRIDRIVDLIDFKSREEFSISTNRNLLDKYTIPVRRVFQ